jgi:hypothetical protein
VRGLESTDSNRSRTRVEALRELHPFDTDARLKLTSRRQVVGPNAFPSSARYDPAAGTMPGTFLSDRLAVASGPVPHASRGELG